MLRKKVVKDILEAIDASKFSRDDFEITAVEEGEEEFSIRCIVDPEYFFLVYDSQEETKFSVTKCPGVIKKTEDIKIIKGNVAKAVNVWLTHAYEDLISNYNDSTAFIAMKEALLKDIETKQNQYGDEAFTDKEIEDYKKRLDTLEATIESMQEKLNISAENIAEMNNDISAMREVLSKLPKSAWYKFTSNKMFKWVRKSIDSEDVGRAIGSAVKTMIS